MYPCPDLLFFYGYKYEYGCQLDALVCSATWINSDRETDPNG